ncbi:hypothetical protein BCU49_011810 [Vibrio breoganii]
MSNIIPENGLASPSQIGRLIFMFSIILFLFYHKFNLKFALIFIYFIMVEFHGVFLHSNLHGFMFGLVNVSKFLYLYLVYILIKDYIKHDHLSAISFLGKAIKWNLIIIAASLIFCIATGLGNSTYGFGFGTKSFFASGNGLGLYLGVMTLISVYLKKSGYYKNISLITLLVISSSIALIGSKAAFVFAVVCIFSVLYISRFRIPVFLIVSLMFVLGGYLFIDAFHLLFDVVIKRYSTSNNMIEFLGSGRYDYVDNAFKDIFSQQHYLVRLLIGSGAFLSFQSPDVVTGYDTLETDFFDILFMYGIVGLLFIAMIGLYMIFKSRKDIVLFIATLLYILHSIIAGHVIFNGMSSICLVVLFVVVKYYTGKKLRY